MLLSLQALHSPRGSPLYSPMAWDGPHCDKEGGSYPKTRSTACIASVFSATGPHEGTSTNPACFQFGNAVQAAEAA